jgi:hypothetical protein
MAEAKNNIDQTKIAGYLIGGSLLYFGLLRPILQRTGIIQDQKAVDIDAEIQKNRGADASNPWNPNYYKSVKNSDWLPWKAATALATQIYMSKAPSSKNWFTDNEISAIAAFNQINTKKKLSMLSAAFQKLYIRDLYAYLESFMNKDQLTSINNKVRNIK